MPFHGRPLQRLESSKTSLRPSASCNSTANDNPTLTAPSRPATGQTSQDGSTPTPADQAYYYFLAILNTTAELRPLYSEYLELLRRRSSTQQLEQILSRSLKVDRDLLITHRLDQARAWYEPSPPDAIAGYAGVVREGSAAF